MISRLSTTLIGWCICLQIFGQASVSSLAFPKTDSSDWVIHHTGFSLNYDIEHRQARWVAYEITPEKMVKVTSRSDRFLPDPQVNHHTATNGDYTGSGYDRGHLAPAADMCWSIDAMKESFYFSNICPQVPGFNRGIWKLLENQVRIWANAFDQLYVVTGPVLTGDTLTRIGLNEIPVPSYFYKALLGITGQEYHAVAFIIPNEKTSLNLLDFKITVDSVEASTGLDLFFHLSDSIEESIESKITNERWFLNKTIAQPNLTSKISETESAQCQGVTKQGDRCKNVTKNSNTFCHFHSGK